MINFCPLFVLLYSGIIFFNSSTYFDNPLPPLPLAPLKFLDIAAASSAIVRCRLDISSWAIDAVLPMTLLGPVVHMVANSDVLVAKMICHLIPTEVLLKVAGAKRWVVQYLVGEVLLTNISGW